MAILARQGAFHRVSGMIAVLQPQYGNMQDSNFAICNMAMKQYKKYASVAMRQLWQYAIWKKSNMPRCLWWGWVARLQCGNQLVCHLSLLLPSYPYCKYIKYYKCMDFIHVPACPHMTNTWNSFEHISGTLSDWFLALSKRIQTVEFLSVLQNFISHITYMVLV